MKIVISLCSDWCPLQILAFGEQVWKQTATFEEIPLQNWIGLSFNIYAIDSSGIDIEKDSPCFIGTFLSLVKKDVSLSPHIIRALKMLFSNFPDKLFPNSHPCLSYIDIYYLTHLIFYYKTQKLYINLILLITGIMFEFSRELIKHINIART